jgi:hypothetical protein
MVRVCNIVYNDLAQILIFVCTDQIVITDLGGGETVSAFSQSGWWTKVMGSCIIPVSNLCAIIFHFKSLVVASFLSCISKSLLRFPSSASDESL